MPKAVLSASRLRRNWRATLPGLYPDYLSTVEALSGRSVHLRTQAAINTDEEDGTRVAMSEQEAAVERVGFDRRPDWRLSLPDARLSDKIQSAAL